MKKKKKKKRHFSILRFLISLICLLFIGISVVTNMLFSKESVPKVGDRYLYIVGQMNPMLGDVTTGAALIAKDASEVSIAAGDIVICYPADNPEQLTLRSINAVMTTENGTEHYYTRDALHEDTTDSITKDKIVAVCTGYPESLELGNFIKFTLDIKGIVAELIVPCIVLIFMLILTMASGRRDEDDEDDEDYNFYDYDEKAKNKPEKPVHVRPATPLYEPEVQPSDEFERKRQSIAENFSRKEVNPDSPYQKERERTMQFKAQRAERASQTGQFRSVNTSDTTKTPVQRERVYERPTTPAERPAPPERPSFKPISDPITDNTGIIPKAEVEEIQKSEPVKAPEPEKPVIVKSSTPDISDIISKTDSDSKKRSTSDISVDELIKLIEQDKKRS